MRFHGGPEKGNETFPDSFIHTIRNVSFIHTFPDSFIRFHGPEKAKQLWAESGPADPAAKTAGKTGGTAGPKKAGDKSRDSLEKEIAALEAQLAAKK